MRRTATIVLVVLLGTLAQAASAQSQRYPYGCVEKETRRESWMDRVPLGCTSSNFSGAQFDSRADFSSAQFASEAYFIDTQFDSLADFSFAEFDSGAYFSGAQFWSPVDFRHARFDSAATASFARTTVRDTLFAG